MTECQRPGEVSGPGRSPATPAGASGFLPASTGICFISMRLLTGWAPRRCRRRFFVPRGKPPSFRHTLKQIPKAKSWHLCWDKARIGHRGMRIIGGMAPPVQAQAKPAATKCFWCNSCEKPPFPLAFPVLIGRLAGNMNVAAGRMSRRIAVWPGLPSRPELRFAIMSPVLYPQKNP